MPPSSSAFTDSLWEEFAQVDVADVVVDIEAPDLQSSYSYRVPEPLRNTLCLGACVHIPFSGRETLGYVLDRRKLAANDPLCRKLKDIIALVEDAITINDEQLQLVRWMRERYVCDLLSAIRCVAPATLGARVATVARLKEPSLRGTDAGSSLPQAHVIETLRALDGEAEVEALREAAHLPGFGGAYAALVKKGLLVETRRITRAKTVGKTIKIYALGAAAEVLSGASGGVGRRSPQQQRLLDRLVDRARHGEGPVPGDELLREAEASSASLRGLVAKGLVSVSEQTVRRAPIVSPEKRTTAPPLTPAQQRATALLREAIASRQAQTLLLFGVTASGKTEVYLDAIAATLNAGRTAIALVPEIALTGQVVDVFTGRFGDQVAVLHSRLSEGERHDEWRRMQAGKARIVVGARSAIFAPLENVGLIVLDEEHEASYKQENTPRYSAKELAAERARLSGAVLLLGSATPSLESYFATEPENAAQVPTPFRRIEMRERIDNRPLPRVTVVDLREEFKQRRALFSTRLVDALAERLRARQQTILFLNRRGYAQFVLCRDCGYVARCPHCAVSLAFHAYDRSLRCHHCEHTARAPQLCPDCGGARVRAFGIGTEKVEEEVLSLFPSARVARMDRDTTARKGEHTRIVRDFRRGEADILIGTQMVAKGLDFPNVTLVGVVSADTAINMPDFRAAERTFQLLTQVAGRSGRGDAPGEVIIQTFSPDHYAVQAAMRQDYLAFYQQEILFRQELRYPPFSRFANLICADEMEARAHARAETLAAALRAVVGP
ncbi:MAG TPA: primosomal protein N', partial [Chthonomonadaceae bacterium]|nr:primosomal protein N' [Chthonomonadaceae bacterium]